MKRALTLLSGVGAGLYPIVSCALGLGDLQVDSRLNQPLRAHIEISDVSEEEWRQIHARLAQEGEDGGALLRTVLDSIVFRTTEDASHRHFVEVSSRDPITEPLFDLSVEVAGQTVQVIRNYSVFLDPPGRDEVGSRGVWVAGNAGESPGVATAGGADGVAAGAGGAAARVPAQGAGAAGAVSGTSASSGAPASAADRGVAGAAGSSARVNARSAARAAAGRRSAAGSGVAAAGSAGGAGKAGDVGARSGGIVAGAPGSTGARGKAGAASGASGVGAGGGAAASTAAGAGASQQPALQAGAVYTVVPSDTLERIVRRLGAHTAAAKNQQMQWVFEHNPAAFYGSVDRLRAGAQLTLPQQSAVAAIVANTLGAANSADAANAPNASAIHTAPAAQVAAAGQKVATADDRALQSQLESQVSTLQQSLAKMQETIAAQDAEIADLNRKIATRAEQQRAERATNALAAHIAPEVASASDDGAQESSAAPSRSESVNASAEQAGSDAGTARAVAAARSSDDTTVAMQPPRWGARRTTYYWGGALGAAAILLAVLVTVVRRRREAEEAQYAPRYPLVEDSPFRYRATLESPPVKQATQQPEPGGPMGQPEVRKPSSGMHVEEGPRESGLESWSTQTALLLSDLPAAEDTQPFMMAPHDDVEAEYESKRKSYTSNTEEPTAKLEAMDANTAELQTTGELMSPEELEEAELSGLDDPSGPEDRGGQDEGHWPPSASGRAGQDESRRPPSGPEHSWYRDGRAGPSGSGERDRNAGGPRQFGQGDTRPAANEPGPFGQGEGRAGPGQGPLAKGGASSPAGDDARTMEIGSEELLGAEALAAPTNPEAMRTVEMDLAQLREAESRHDRTAVNKLAEDLEASLSYEPDRVDIQLKLLEIYHHEALGNRDNFRSLLSKLAKDSRLLSPAQRERVETLQRTLNDGKPDPDATFVADVAI